jgi:hypothetical protein
MLSVACFLPVINYICHYALLVLLCQTSHSSSPFGLALRTSLSFVKQAILPLPLVEHSIPRPLYSGEPFFLSLWSSTPYLAPLICGQVSHFLSLWSSTTYLSLSIGLWSRRAKCSPHVRQAKPRIISQFE